MFFNVLFLYSFPKTMSTHSALNIITTTKDEINAPNTKPVLLKGKSSYFLPKIYKTIFKKGKG